MTLKKRALEELLEIAIEYPGYVRPSMLDVIAALSKQHPISTSDAEELNSIADSLDGKRRDFLRQESRGR